MQRTFNIRTLRCQKHGVHEKGDFLRLLLGAEMAVSKATGGLTGKTRRKTQMSFLQRRYSCCQIIYHTSILHRLISPPRYRVIHIGSPVMKSQSGLNRRFFQGGWANSLPPLDYFDRPRQRSQRRRFSSKSPNKC